MNSIFSCYLLLDMIKLVHKFAYAFSHWRRLTTVGFPKAKTELSGFRRLWWMRCDLW